MDVNKVMLIGRLGKDPELKTLDGGNAVVSLSLATGESWTGKDGQKQEKTEWHRVVAWGKLAENCAKYLKKGSQAYVEGKLSTRQWENKDKQKQYTTEIVASTVNFLSTPSGGGRDEPPPPSAPQGPESDGGGLF
jgi:single-strand DNA-binding protein